MNQALKSHFTPYLLDVKSFQPGPICLGIKRIMYWYYNLTIIFTCKSPQICNNNPIISAIIYAAVTAGLYKVAIIIIILFVCQ